MDYLWIVLESYRRCLFGAVDEQILQDSWVAECESLNLEYEILLGM